MRKLTPIFFLILISAGSLISLAVAQYGESSTSLGQFTDEFSDLDNVSVQVDVVRNATYNAMELNHSTRFVFEDFTTYTEVDEDGDITITALKVDWVTMRRDAETYVYKDFNPNYFGDFEFQYELNISDVEAGDSSSASIMGISLTNVTGVMDDLQGGSILSVSFQQNKAVDDEYGFYIRQFDGGVSQFLVGNGLDFHDVSEGEIYSTFSRVGTNVTLWMYSDSARTTLLYKYSWNFAVLDTYRYFQISNWGRDIDAANHFTGYVENVTLVGDVGYVTEGYFTTTDYLDQANGSILVLMTNTTIPENTGITVELSEDNATWALNDWEPLVGGFESIDLRELNWSSSCYLRYNFTSPGGDTPRLYQSRLITTEGASANGAPSVTIIESDFPWIAIAIILMCVAYLLARYL